MLYIDKKGDVFLKETGKYTKLHIDILKDDINLIPTTEIFYCDKLKDTNEISYEKLKEKILKQK